MLSGLPGAFGSTPLPSVGGDADMLPPLHQRLGASSSLEAEEEGARGAVAAAGTTGVSMAAAMTAGRRLGTVSSPEADGAVPASAVNTGAAVGAADNAGAAAAGSAGGSGAAAAAADSAEGSLHVLRWLGAWPGEPEIKHRLWPGGGDVGSSHTGPAAADDTGGDTTEVGVHVLRWLGALSGGGEGSRYVYDDAVADGIPGSETAPAHGACSVTDMLLLLDYYTDILLHYTTALRLRRLGRLWSPILGNGAGRPTPRYVLQHRHTPTILLY